MKMTKYQLEHFKRKVDRQFDPLIDEQELLVKQYKTEATDKAVDKLSKKIGADKIINKFREAEKMLEDARATALTFFEKKKPKDQELNYNFRRDNRYNDDKLTGVKSTVTKMKDKSGLFASCAYFLSSVLFAIALIFNDFNLIIIIFIFGLGLWQSYYALNTKITEIHKFNKGFNNSNLCGFLIWLGMIINIYFMN